MHVSDKCGSFYSLTCIIKYSKDLWSIPTTNRSPLMSNPSSLSVFLRNLFGWMVS